MSHKLDGGHGGNHAKKAPSKRQDRRFQDVWASNLEEEMARIQDQIESFQFISLDTLLPGIVAQPTGPFESYADYNYQTLRSNVDLTRALQICFTLSDESGIRPKGLSSWRFNIAFDASKDLLGQVQNDSEIDLARHRDHGITASDFGESLMSSGLVLNDEVKWVVYCGTSNFSERAEDKVNGKASSEPASTTFCGLYNFAHLLQFLTSQPLPEDIVGLNEACELFFPSRCDLGAFVQHLPPALLSSRDASDPWRRPMYCSGHHVLEAFFRLPDAIRSTAFDGSPELPIPEPRSAEKHQRRHKEGKKNRDTSGGAAPAAARVARGGVASSAQPLNGVAKTGGG